MKQWAGMQINIFKGTMLHEKHVGRYAGRHIYRYLTFNNTQVQKQLPETIWQVQHKKEIELIMLK